jgi:hypothetical protein
MSANTTPDGITYPVGTDAIAPLHTVFAVMASTMQTALNNRTWLKTVADLNGLAALTGMPTGAQAVVNDGCGVFQYNGTSWYQIDSGRFATTTLRDTAFAKASGAYLVSWMVQCYVTANAGQFTVYRGAAWVALSGIGQRQILADTYQYSNAQSASFAASMTDVASVVVSATPSGGKVRATLDGWLLNQGSGASRTAQIQFLSNGTLVGNASPAILVAFLSGQTAVYVRWIAEWTPAAGTAISVKLQALASNISSVGITEAHLTLEEII